MPVVPRRVLITAPVDLGGLGREAADDRGTVLGLAEAVRDRVQGMVHQELIACGGVQVTAPLTRAQGRSTPMSQKAGQWMARLHPQGAAARSASTAGHVAGRARERRSLHRGSAAVVREPVA